MLADTLSVYPHDGAYLVLNPKVPAWIVTNATGVAVIQEYCGCLSVEQTARSIHAQNPGISAESVMRFLRGAESESLFREDEVPHVHKPYFLRALYLNMTERCNLRCSYCYAATRTEHGASGLGLDDYKRVLDGVRTLCGGTMDIIFTGGEPLLSENTLPVARYARSLGFSARLLTNATLIDERNVAELCRVFDLFKISIDGSAEHIHDGYRGAGSYQKAVHAIGLLREHGANVQVAMTVTKSNRGDVVAMSQKWGAMLGYQPLFPMGRAQDGQSDNALTGTEYYEALCQGKDINPFTDIQGIISAHKATGSILKCSMGDGELSVSCTGDVYPCQLLHHDEFLLGNVRDTPFEQLYNGEKNARYKAHTVDRMAPCRDCDFRYVCGGACQARHYSQTGSIDTAGDFCAYEKLGIVSGLVSSCTLQPCE